MSFGGEDPIAAGWAQSHAHPGGNITGVVMLSPDQDSKRLHLLHDSFAARRRIAVLFHSRSRNTPTDRAVQETAKSIGLDLRSFYASGREEYEATFNAIRSSGADALLIASSPTMLRFLLSWP
jgi:putative tryptophan/tyrosine transport system substrate-binding protein